MSDKLDQLRELGLEPLEVTCTEAVCEVGLHCFKPLSRSPHADGSCRECGAELVDWEAAHALDSKQLPRVVEGLKHETMRHVYWCEPFPERAEAYAARKGRDGLLERVPIQLRSRLKKKASENPRGDGRQTKVGVEAQTIDWAQHATATCCRKCLGYWHGIDPEADISDEQYAYLTDLVVYYLETRLPELWHELPLLPSPEPG